MVNPIVATIFTFGCIAGGLMVYSIRKLFREIDEEMDLKERIDELEER